MTSKEEMVSANAAGTFVIVIIVSLVTGVFFGGILGHAAGYNCALADLYQNQNKIEVKK